MEELNTDVLVKLRQEVVGSSLPLVDDQSLPVEKRFTLVMSLLQADPSVELLRKAYNYALEISDPSMKTDALLDVVDEIDLLLDSTRASVE